MKLLSLLMIFAVGTVLISCGKGNSETNAQKPGKIGVLIISHGSHSEKWRNMLAQTAESAKKEILKNKNISGVKQAFMEYNEPSIATQMKEFDKEGYSDVIIVPMFLTVSGHSFDDIPHILGIKASQTEIDKLKEEKIEIYKPKAKTHITPLLDFPAYLGDNLVRRVKALSTNPAEEGCVIVAYGDQKYLTEWTAMMGDMQKKIAAELGIGTTEHAWCGHLVHYESKPTTEAIDKVLSTKETAIVVPALLAVDEMFQMKIIGGAIEKSKASDRVKYKPDAILPDTNIEKWIVDISNKYVNDLLNPKN